jgi:hypothetical protein
MKEITMIGLFIAGFIANGFSAALVDKIKFASVDTAKKLLLQEDEFTKSWSQFDIDSRMQKQNSKKEELLDFISKQAKEWSLDEKKKILSIFESIDKQILKQKFRIAFPDEIYFVKTTANEEGGAGGYTRANYVVLKEDILSRPKGELTQTIVHELFHILTRANPDFRREMYRIIGFKLMNQIDYPDGLKSYRITNPDAPQTDSYIQLKVNGKTVECMMILYSNKDYDGGDFFKYLNVGFLSLTGNMDKSIVLVDNKPVIYNFEQVTGFFEQVGKNTQYIIHPEEILADNFAFAILNKTGLPDQDIVDKIKMKLKK